MHDDVTGDIGGEVRRAATQDGVDRRAVIQHQDHDARAPENFGGTGRDFRAGRAQGLAAVGGTVPDDQLGSRPGQIERHGLPHDAETDETDIHDASARCGQAMTADELTRVEVCRVARTGIAWRACAPRCYPSLSRRRVRRRGAGSAKGPEAV